MKGHRRSCPNCGAEIRSKAKECPECMATLRVVREKKNGLNMFETVVDEYPTKKVKTKRQKGKIKVITLEDGKYEVRVRMVLPGGNVCPRCLTTIYHPNCYTCETTVTCFECGALVTFKVDLIGYDDLD